MKALIHIGMPKAGSSSIQEFLRINREALVQRGLRYAPFDPKFGSQFELGATGLVAAGATLDRALAQLVMEVHNPDDARAYTEKFRDFLDAGLGQWREETYVASSEHIVVWLNTPDRVRALDGFLTARFSEVRYLLYLRPQADLLLSGYSERIRRGSTLSLDAHVENRLKSLNYLPIVRRWEAAVGPERLELRLLAPDFLQDGDLISDFCTVTGASPEGLTRPPRMNNALTSGDIRVRRRLNRFMRLRRAGGASNPWYLAALYTARALGLRGGAPLALTEAQKARINAEYSDPNERLRARRFPDRASLF